MAGSLLKRSFSVAIPKESYLNEGEVTARVINVITSIRSSPPCVHPNSYYVRDLNFDSMIRNELVGKLSNEFCVPISDDVADSITISVAGTIKYFASHPKAR
jgi:acyl carrier protein